MKKALSGVLAALVLLSSLPTTMTASALPDNSGAESRNVAHTLYVSTAGNDNTGDGTQDNPFATIEKAKEKVRDLPKTGGDIVVEIADGTYFLENTIEFTPEDSGSDECTIYYKAAEGANPVISGGRLIEGDWQEEGGGIYSIEYQRDEKLRALYVNGERAYMTSKKLWGNGGYGTYHIDQNDTWAWKSGDNSLGTKFTKGDIPLDTRNPDDIELMTQTTWNTAIVCVDELVDIGNNEISANLQMPYGAIAQQPSWNNYYKTSGDQMVYNVFEWLDEPGEFYFDKTEKRLYYYPREGENLENAEVIAPELETLVNLQGESTSSRVHDIAFEGLTFAHTDWNLYEVEGSYGRATVQGAAGITAYADGNWHPYIYRAYDVGPGAVMASSATNLAFENNTICHTGNDGLSLVNDVTNTVVNGNIIYDLAGSSILIGHPQHVYIGDKGSNKGQFSDKEKYDVGVEGACEYLTVTNNFLSDTSKMFWGDAGVMIFLGAHITYQYNYLQNTPYAGLSLGWGWWNMDGSSGSVVPGEPMTTTHDNTIANNVFRNTITILGDAGAIYTLGDMPDTIISENYIDSIGTPGTDPYHIRGIHVDEGTKHVLGERNVIEIPTDLTCVDCGNWGNKGDNVWNDNYSTSASYTTTGNMEPGTVVTNAHTSEKGIWGLDVFEILANAGPGDEYLARVPESLYNMQDELLSTKFYVAPEQELDFKVDQSYLQSEIWLAPEGTQEFTEGNTMTKAADGKIKAPSEAGNYKLYLVNGQEVSQASKGEIIVSGVSLTENVEEGGRYQTSQLKPFKVELKTEYLSKALLNGEEISSGHKIPEEGEYTLTLTDLTNAESTIHFSTYITDVDKTFSKNTVSNPSEEVALTQCGSDAIAWFVPEGEEISDAAQLAESDTMTKSAEINPASILAPKASGRYVLYLVKDSAVSEPSAAVLTVSSSEIPVTDGMLARFNADSIEAAGGEKISQWANEVGEQTLVQTDESKQPTLKTTELGMNYVEFDGTSNQMAFDSGLDLNGKSELTILAFSSYTGEDPDNSWGDTRSTLYFGETAGWGSVYLSSYGGYVAARFGSGQTDNYIREYRSERNSDFIMTAMVKDGTTEYLYDAGKLVKTETGKNEKIANTSDIMTVGYTASGAPGYFKGGISEILIYDRALSEEEIAQLQVYMMQKAYLSALNPALDNASEILNEDGAEDKYSETSLNNLQEKYNKALEVKASVVEGNCSYEEVKTAYQELVNAIDGLREAITEIPDEDLNLWLKADEGVELGQDGRISVWKDNSGNGNNATIAQNPQAGENLTSPTLVEDGYNGKPVVRFNGTSDGMQFPFDNLDQTAEATVVIVSSSKSDRSDTMGGDNIPLLYFHEYGAGWSKFVVTPTQSNINARFGSGNSADNGGFMLYERPENIGDSFSTTMVVKNGASETIYVGDQQVMNRDNGAAVFTNVKDDIGYIGRYPVGSHSENWYNQSDVAEIMIYNRALGLVEIQQINAYLNEKYSEKPEVTLESITVSGPTKTEYEIGDELDLTGLVVTAHYSDGSEAAVEDYEVSGFDSSTAGEKTITVTYQDKTTAFTVNVKEAAPVVTLESITVTGPNKTEYEIGDELDLTGLVVTAYYSDGNEKVLSAGDYEVSGFDSSTAGEKTITVTYQDKTTTFTVNVKEAAPVVTLESITVTGPNKTEYKIGEELDLTGLVVTAHYSTGDEATVTGYEVSGFDSSTAGEKTITVTYQGKTAAFKVTVKETEKPVVTLESITISGPTKTEYKIGDKLDLTDLVVIAHYSDGSYQEVTDYEVSGFDSAAAGEKTVTVTYQGETVSFKITVKEDTASSEQPGESGKPDDNQSSSQPDDTQSSSGSQDDQNIQTGDSMAPYVGVAIVLILLSGLGIAIALIIRRRRLG